MALLLSSGSVSLLLLCECFSSSKPLLLLSVWSLLGLVVFALLGYVQISFPSAMFKGSEMSLVLISRDHFCNFF